MVGRLANLTGWRLYWTACLCAGFGGLLFRLVWGP